MDRKLFVVTCPSALSTDQMNSIRDGVQEVVGDQHRVVVLTEGCHLYSVPLDKDASD